MSQFQKFQNSAFEYSRIFPKYISIYIHLHKGNCLIPEDKLTYQFLISKEGIPKFTREKKKVKNTLTLYQTILNDFFQNNLLLTLNYFDSKVKNEYKGIQLKNSLGNYLYLYFANNTLSSYQELLTKLQKRKQEDYYKYGTQLIKNQNVHTIVFRPSLNSGSEIQFTHQEEKTTWILAKERCLEYFYQKNDHQINPEDLPLILNFIVIFINYNLDKDPQYQYQINGKYQTSALTIFCANHDKIIIEDNDLIEIIEKSGLIDYLWEIIHKKRTIMPITEEFYTLKLSKNKKGLY